MVSSPTLAVTVGMAAFLSIVPAYPSGNVLRVGHPGGFSTITAAMAAAQPGDTVLVGPGQYRENLVIEKPIVLVGQGEAHIIGLGEGDVVQIRADDVELSGFTVSGSGTQMLVSDAGINILGARARIRDNSLVDNLFGIYLRGAEEALVEGNTIRGRAEVDIGRRGAGVHLYDAQHNVIRDNRVSFVRDGVYFDHADYNVVEDNEFSDLRYGVHYMYCKNNRFYRNVFRDSLGGVAVMYTDHVTFSDNQILNNRTGHNAFGLLLKDCLDSVAERNVIVNNVNGIFLDNSHRNRFLGNLIAYNDVGVMLHASSLQSTFSRNDFVGNLATLHTVGRADADWTPDGVGNHYSDYAGYDVDGDGIGDTEYSLQDAFEYLEGGRPLLQLFLNSAASDALAMAERSFPIVPSSDERDRAPRMKPVSGAKLTYRYEPGRSRLDSHLLAAGAVVALFFSGWLCWRLRL